jgi:hypothetical protein
MKRKCVGFFFLLIWLSPTHRAVRAHRPPHADIIPRCPTTRTRGDHYSSSRFTRTARRPSSHAFASFPALALSAAEPLVSVTAAKAMSSLRPSLLLVVSLLAAALLAAAPSSASRDLRPLQASFVVRGRVWCDNCRAGFETPASTYIAGSTPHRSLPLVWLCYATDMLAEFE